MSAEEASSRLEAYLCTTVKNGVQAAAQLGGVQGVDLVEDFALWMGSQVWFINFDIDNSTCCKCLSQVSGGNEAVETAVYVLTTMVVLETAQHVLNIGQGIAEIDMSALTLHQIKNTVKRIEGKVDKILKEPLNTAKLYFDNALMEITNKSYSDAYQTLGAVHILALFGVSGHSWWCF